MQLRPRWMCLLLVFFIIMLVLGAVPGNADALTNRIDDKLLHLIAYSCMAALCFQSLQGRRLIQSLTSLLIIALLGLIDELVQLLLPYRNASLIDWCFDIAAAITVIIFMNLFAPAATKKSPACEKKSAKPSFLSQD
jgi:VanZ family protein